MQIKGLYTLMPRELIKQTEIAIVNQNKKKKIKCSSTLISSCLCDWLIKTNNNRCVCLRAVNANNTRAKVFRLSCLRGVP